MNTWSCILHLSILVESPILVNTFLDFFGLPCVPAHCSVAVAKRNQVVFFTSLEIHVVFLSFVSDIDDYLRFSTLVFVSFSFLYLFISFFLFPRLSNLPLHLPCIPHFSIFPPHHFPYFSLLFLIHCLSFFLLSCSIFLSSLLHFFFPISLLLSFHISLFSRLIFPLFPSFFISFPLLSSQLASSV